MGGSGSVDGRELEVGEHGPDIGTAVASPDGGLVTGELGLDERSRDGSDDGSKEAPHARGKLKRPQASGTEGGKGLGNPHGQVEPGSQNEGQVGRPGGHVHGLCKQGSDKQGALVVNLIRLPIEPRRAPERTQDKVNDGGAHGRGVSGNRTPRPSKYDASRASAAS